MTEKTKKEDIEVIMEPGNLIPSETVNGLKVSGFKKANAEVADGLLNVDGAFLIEEVDFRRFKLQDINYLAGEMPSLPIGIYLNSENGSGEYERITTYSFKKELINDGRAEYDLLEIPENRAGRDPKKHVQKIIAFLANTLETIGEYPVKEFAKRYGNSLEQAIGNFYMADITTMLIGCRIHLHRSLKISVTTECPCERKTRIFDKNESLLHDLEDISIKYFETPPNDGQKPLYEVKLPIPINDGKSNITKIYLSPLKFYQFTRYFDANGQPNVLKQAIEMVAAMPESEIYGTRKGKIFDESLWRSLPSRNKRALEQAMTKLQPGAVMKVRVKCSNCLEQPEFDFPIPWVTGTQFFLYQSIDPILDPED